MVCVKCGGVADLIGISDAFMVSGHYFLKVSFLKVLLGSTKLRDDCHHYISFMQSGSVVIKPVVY